MIRKVTITNYLGESFDLELFYPEKSGFYIKEITGLGPPKSNVNLTEIVTNDGALYNSSRATSRNVVLTLGFFSSIQQSIEDIRHLTYKYFPTKRPLKITVETDNRTSETIGYVETNEPDIFSDMETTQISIICPDSYLYSSELMVTEFEGVVNMFEFPFSNESLTEPLLIMGEIWPRSDRIIDYPGDAEVGAVITIFAHGIVSNLILFNPDTGERMEINSERLEELTGSGIVAGDIIIISTIRGDKGIVLNREGVETNILNALNRDAFWLQFRKGENLFGYTADYGLSNISFRIVNRIAYEGI